MKRFLTGLFFGTLLIVSMADVWAYGGDAPGYDRIRNMKPIQPQVWNHGGNGIPQPGTMPSTSSYDFNDRSLYNPGPASSRPINQPSQGQMYDSTRSWQNSGGFQPTTNNAWHSPPRSQNNGWNTNGGSNPWSNGSW